MNDGVYFYNYHLDTLCVTVQDHKDMRNRHDRSHQTCSLWWKKNSPLEYKHGGSDFRHVAFFKVDGCVPDGWDFHVHHAENGESVVIGFKSTHLLTQVGIETLVIQKGWIKSILKSGDQFREGISLPTPRRLSLT